MTPAYWRSAAWIIFCLLILPTILAIHDGNHLAALMGAGFMMFSGMLALLLRCKAPYKDSDPAVQLISFIGHDLRQPVHALGLLAGSLRGSADKQVLRTARQMESAVFYLSKMVESMLDSSRMQSGRIRSNPVHFNVSSLVDKISRDYSAIANNKGLRFSVTNTAAIIHADPYITERILGNFISNAIRYTSSGGLLIGVRRRRQRNIARIEVHDTGPGVISEKIKAMLAGRVIKETTTAADRTQPAASEGLGIGLHIAKRMADFAGYTIGCISREGRGATFFLEVPLSSRVFGVSSPYGALPASGNYGSLSGIKQVLVIDDDSCAMEGMEMILRGWGIRTLTSTTGNIVDSLNQAPQLAIIDYHLIGENGLDVANRLLARYPGVPVIIISGDPAGVVVISASKNNVSFLSKPIHADQLREVVHRLIANENTTGR